MAAERAVEFVQNGMVIGLGTGSTVHWAILQLGERVQQGLQVRAIGTSSWTEELAHRLHIPLVTFRDVKELDVAIDGADAVAADFSLTKGGGGALLREKLVASAAERFIVVVDHSKRVQYLGQFRLPVEVVPFAWELTQGRIEKFGCRAYLRNQDKAPFVTDNHNYIMDCDFGEIRDPASLHRALKALPGVVETGLFIGMAHAVIDSDGEDVKVEFAEKQGTHRLS